MKAILLVSHGSKELKAYEEIKIFIRRLKKRCLIKFIEPAFLTIQHPRVSEGIQKCVQKGANEILILLNFLNSGKHVSSDICTMINQARDDYPKVHFRVTKPLGQSDYLIDIFLKLIDEA